MRGRFRWWESIARNLSPSSGSIIAGSAGNCLPSLFAAIPEKDWWPRSAGVRPAAHGSFSPRQDLRCWSASHRLRPGHCNQTATALSSLSHDRRVTAETGHTPPLLLRSTTSSDANAAARTTAQAARLKDTPASGAAAAPDRPFISALCRRSALLSPESDQASSHTSALIVMSPMSPTMTHLINLRRFQTPPVSRLPNSRWLTHLCRHQSPGQVYAAGR